MMFRKFPLHRKNQAHKVLGRLLKVLPQLTGVIILSRQLDYNIVALFFQVNFEKGGVSMYIFRAWITTKDGVKIYAKTYGKRAFRIWVGPGPEPKKSN